MSLSHILNIILFFTAALIGATVMGLLAGSMWALLSIIALLWFLLRAIYMMWREDSETLNAEDSNL